MHSNKSLVDYELSCIYSKLSASHRTVLIPISDSDIKIMRNYITSTQQAPKPTCVKFDGA